LFSPIYIDRHILDFHIIEACRYNNKSKTIYKKTLMATTRPFAFNTGSTISGATQIGNLAIGVAAQDYGADPGGVKWWMGPDEDLGYVIGVPVPELNQPTPVGAIGGVQFWRSNVKTDAGFLNIVNTVARKKGQSTFTTNHNAFDWLDFSGFSTSYQQQIAYYTFELNITPWMNYFNNVLSRDENISDGTTIIDDALKITMSPADSPLPRCYVTPGEGIFSGCTYQFNFKYYIPTGSTCSYISMFYGNILQSIASWSTKGIWTDATAKVKLTTNINQYGQYFIEVAMGGDVGAYYYLTDFEVLRVSY
jgi:hypothetical protein